MRKLFSFLIVALFVFVATVDPVIAATYGEGTYGGGAYGDGGSPKSFDLKSPKDKATVTTSRPTFRWSKTSDSLSGLSKYQVIVNDSVHIDDINPSDPGSSEDHVRKDDSKHIRYDGDYIEAYSSKQNGELDEGKHTWKVRAYDSADNYTDTEERVLNVDLTPDMSLSEIGSMSVDLSFEGETFVTSKQRPTFAGSAGDEVVEVVTTINSDPITCVTEVDDGEWECKPKKRIPFGIHVVTITAEDGDGNMSTLPKFNLIVTGQLRTEIIETKTIPRQEQEEAEPETEEVPVEEPDEEEELLQTYDVKVKVVDMEEDPVKGATVTLFSTPREAVTDENGEVAFAEVERGEHTVVVDYNGQVGEQKVSLDGDVEEFQFTIQIEARNPFTFPSVIVVLSALGLIISVLVFLLWRRRRHA